MMTLLVNKSITSNYLFSKPKQLESMMMQEALKFHQEEYQKLKSNEQQELVQNYEEFKGLFGKSQEEVLDESNPFFESSQDGNNPFEEENASSTNPFDNDEAE